MHPARTHCGNLTSDKMYCGGDYLNRSGVRWCSCYCSIVRLCDKLHSWVPFRLYIVGHIQETRNCLVMLYLFHFFAVKNTSTHTWFHNVALVFS